MKQDMVTLAAILFLTPDPDMTLINFLTRKLQIQAVGLLQNVKERCNVTQHMQSATLDYHAHVHRCTQDRIMTFDL